MDIKEINSFINEAVSIDVDSYPEFPEQFRCLGTKCPTHIALRFIRLGEVLKDYIDEDSARDQLIMESVCSNPQSELVLDDN
tara:strand:+ start:2082 stop:2327 length:246 start_codon:yes stop_codon:yes gene_type:complete